MEILNVVTDRVKSAKNMRIYKDRAPGTHIFMYPSPRLM